MIFLQNHLLLLNGNSFDFGITILDFGFKRGRILANSSLFYRLINPIVMFRELELNFAPQLNF
jgi:hypothetical protein